VIYSEKNECKNIFFIVEGDFLMQKKVLVEKVQDSPMGKIRRRLSNVNEVPILLMSKGQTFGLNEILLKKPFRESSVICTSSTAKLIILPKNVLILPFLLTPQKFLPMFQSQEKKLMINHVQCKKTLQEKIVQSNQKYQQLEEML